MAFYKWIEIAIKSDEIGPSQLDLALFIFFTWSRILRLQECLTSIKAGLKNNFKLRHDPGSMQRETSTKEGKSAMWSQ